MGFFTRFGGSRIPMEEQVVQVKVTTDGMTKLQKMEPAGLEFDVLAEIKKQEPCTVSEIARALNRPENKIRFIMRGLHAKKWISTS